MQTPYIPRFIAYMMCCGSAGVYSVWTGAAHFDEYPLSTALVIATLLYAAPIVFERILLKD